MHQLKILLSKLKLKNSKGKELNATNKKLFNEFIDDFCSVKANYALRGRLKIVNTANEGTLPRTVSSKKTYKFVSVDVS